MEFVSHESAKAAVEALNGKKLDDARQPLIVMRAQRKAERIEAVKHNNAVRAPQTEVYPPVSCRPLITRMQTCM